MSLAFCLSFSVIRYLLRSFRSSGLKLSFFGSLETWQYWQFWAGLPSFLASGKSWGVAAPGDAERALTSTAATAASSVVRVLPVPPCDLIARVGCPGAARRDPPFPATGRLARALC